MNKEVLIRKAEKKDTLILKEMICDTILLTCNNEYSPTQLAAWTSSIKKNFDWENRLSKQRGWVAIFDKIIVGLITLKDEDYIDFMYVHHAYQRMGIAGKLYHQAYQEALKNRIDKLYSDVSKTARPFFEHKGFSVLKENRNQVNGIELVNYRMVKELV